MTDHPITQIPWWSEKLALLGRPSVPAPLLSLAYAWATIRASRTYDVFLTANVRNALALGLFKRLFRRRRPLLVMTEMRLDDPRPGLTWRLKVALQRYAYAAADALCVSARREIDEYASRLRLPRARFRFVPWHTNVLDPQWRPPGAYLFAAGRTGRDWRTLADAVRGLDVPVTVVCTKADAASVDFPSSVTVCTDIPYARYRELLEGAAAVVLPLEAHTFSSGQVVILEAMALGKAVVASRVLGSEDYILDGVTGVLVEPGDSRSLRSALERLMRTDGLPERLGRAAVDQVVASHTLDQYVRKLVGIADHVHREELRHENPGPDRR